VTLVPLDTGVALEVQEFGAGHGRHDRKTRYEGAAYLAERLPDARLVTFEDSAHCPHVGEAQRFNAVLLEFLRPASSPG
jgi:pimeloyl-ACP methyl ester carboxylesterase